MSIATIDYADVLHNEATEDASCFVSDDVLQYRYPPEGPDSQERLLRLVVLQIDVDSPRPRHKNLASPSETLEFILVDETGQMIFEDRFAYDHWGQFLFHGWRKYDKSRETYVDENNNPIDDRIHNDANPTKAFEYGEAMSQMTKDRVYPRKIERNPAIRALKTHTLWKLRR